MKLVLFYLAAVALILFEFLKIYFIIPMPGSQRIESIEMAYLLYSWRWYARGLLVLIMIITLPRTIKFNRWIVYGVISLLVFVSYLANFQWSPDQTFKLVENLVIADSTENQVPLEKLVLGVTIEGESRAYPIQYISYHHQVIDTIGDQRIMVTYCSVCRSGRVFEPKINDKDEEFRLVGMDHFNAMFEDRTTETWWRQANGEAIIGPLTGYILPELFTQQMTLQQWLASYPDSKIMQPDPAYTNEYEGLDDYDIGVTRESHLTRTDTVSWNDKAWVIGMEVEDISKAWDWNELKKKRYINDIIGTKPILILLTSDNQSFFVYERPDNKLLTIERDTIRGVNMAYSLQGQPLLANLKPLKKVQAYQEFWHSWRTFHPETLH